jgi:hypothetical protein
VWISILNIRAVGSFWFTMHDRSKKNEKRRMKRSLRCDRIWTRMTADAPVCSSPFDAVFQCGLCGHVVPSNNPINRSRRRYSLAVWFRARRTIGMNSILSTHPLWWCAARYWHVLQHCNNQFRFSTEIFHKNKSDFVAEDTRCTQNCLRMCLLERIGRWMCI